MRTTLLAVGLLSLALGCPSGAEVLRFRLPAYLAGEDGCSEGMVPLDSISAVELWRLEGANLFLERTRSPLVAPGEEETLAVVPGSGQVTYYVTTRAPFSRSSCMSNLVTFNGRADAGPAGGPGTGPWLGFARPNPSGGLVAVSWCLPSAARARLEVVDIAGRVVARLEDSDHAAGVHVSVWDARRAAPGIYLMRARSGGWSAARRVLVLH
jgi:hypothetical protein